MKALRTLVHHCSHSYYTSSSGRLPYLLFTCRLSDIWSLRTKIRWLFKIFRITVSTHKLQDSKSLYLKTLQHDKDHRRHLQRRPLSSPFCVQPSCYYACAEKGLVTSFCRMASAERTPERQRWYFSSDLLRRTPSILSSMDPEKELSYRQQAASLVQDIGQKLNVYGSRQKSYRTSVVAWDLNGFV